MAVTEAGHELQRGRSPRRRRAEQPQPPGRADVLVARERSLPVVGAAGLLGRLVGWFDEVEMGGGTWPEVGVRCAGRRTILIGIDRSLRIAHLEVSVGEHGDECDDD